jgi:HPt (histidine-containing phosphotransfer) domain-containing protein
MALAHTAMADDIDTGRVDERADAGTKPIDFTYLRRFTLGNKELEREVLFLFAEGAPGYLKALDEAVTAKEWHDAAHTLKGSARAVGAWRVARCAEVAEKLRFDIDRERRDFAIDTAYEAATEALRYIRVVFPAGGPDFSP